MLIVSGDGEPLVRELRITRLAEGVDAAGELAGVAIDRTVAALEEFGALLRTWDVGPRRLVVTAAGRDASNVTALVACAERAVGARAEILDGRAEAALAYAGATADLPPGSGTPTIVDIGGGSTEVAATIDEEFVAASVQLGCVRVTERTLEAGPATAAQLAAARAMIERELDAGWAAAPALTTLAGRALLLGLAGTVGTLAQLDAGQATYRRSDVHHRVLGREVVAAWRERLARETETQRLAHPGVTAGRADVLVGGLLILEAIMDRLACATVTASEADLLDGAVRALG